MALMEAIRSRLAGIFAFLAILVTVLFIYQLENPQVRLFAVVFAFRYLRLAINWVGHSLYRPAPRPERPFYSSNDFTVILPTIDPHNANFLASLDSIWLNRPSRIMIVTAGTRLHNEVKTVAKEWLSRNPDADITVTATPVPGKRGQVASVLPFVITALTVLVDDSVVWGPRLLQEMCNAFEDKRVGLVGVSKYVTPEAHPTLWQRFWNFLGRSYLERNGWDARATWAVDSCVSVVSGRTSGLRTHLVSNATFIEHFTHEKYFFGLRDDLGPDDDNTITRWVLNKGYTIRWQESPDATVSTRLGTYPRYLHQNLRWARTTYRSNPISLFKDRMFVRYPWTGFSACFCGMLNLAAIWDPLVTWRLYKVVCEFGWSSYPLLFTLALAIPFIAGTKVIKMRALLQTREDFVLLLLAMGFAYYHSFIKLRAALTFWDGSWSGRTLDSGDGGVQGAAAEAAIPVRLVVDAPAEEETEENKAKTESDKKADAKVDTKADTTEKTKAEKKGHRRSATAPGPIIDAANHVSAPDGSSLMD